jgi:NADPH-dependent 7-cyano-7-deazaguanine reductase QueF-like protein
MLRFLLSLNILLLFASIVSAQCDTSQNVIVKITVKTDSFPKDIGWSLFANKNNTILGLNPPGTYTEPEFTYIHSFCVPKGQCLRLFLTDTKGDGISYPGLVKIEVNDKPYSYISYFSYAYFEYINCSEGETCGTPQTISEGKFVTKYASQFYSFTPSQSGIYKISTCDSVNTCDTKIWIYEECKTFNPDNSILGSFLYSDDNGGCDSLANLPNAILEKNKPYLIRVGGDKCKDKPVTWTLQFVGGITGCMDSTACNYNFLATIPTDDCIPQNDTTCKGPDLTILTKPIMNTMIMGEVNADEDPCLVNEGCLNGFGRRKVLRFDTYIKNIGDQDYYIGKPFGNPAQFAFDNCHQHYHYRGYAEYLLFDDKGQKIPIGFKAGFCVLDFECVDTSNMKYNCVNLGLSTGCTDIYERELDCQWIDITNIPAGKYTFVSRVNWDNSPDRLGRVESRTDNNWAQVCIEIKRIADSVWYEMDTVNCPVFTDCKGVKYGNTIVDCNGVCGGISQHGDMNNNKMQDTDDVLRYMKNAVNQSGTVSPCEDLNADGRISMTDAAMLSSCINYGKRHIHVGSSSFHDHCRFPANIFNTSDTVYFQIQNHNPLGKYFDIAMYNPSTEVNAYQLKIKGVDVWKAINLVDTSKYNAKPIVGLGTNIIGGLSVQDSVIRKSPSFKPLVRLYYNAVTSNSTAQIEAVTDVTEINAYSVVPKVVGNNLQIVRNNDIELMNLNVVLQPHPINHYAVLSFYNPENLPFQLEIFDLNGKSVMAQNNITVSEINISSENWSSGIYFYKLSGVAGYATGKIIKVD